MSDKKYYLTIFIVSFLSFILIFTIGFALFGGFGKVNIPSIIPQNGNNSSGIGMGEDDNLPKTDDQIKEESSIVNILAFGINGGLADTIMVMSFNPEDNSMNIVSVPRDTYNEVEGYNDPAQRKINSVYGMTYEGGAELLKEEVSKLLDIPIHYFVRVNFSGVAAIVDTLGGYDVNVPFDMLYDDPYQDLHINISAGQQTLNGSDAVKYLRFRQNNSGTVREGDVQRIARQQHFVVQMIEKSVSRLAQVLNTVISSSFIITNMSIDEALEFAVKASKLTGDNIHIQTLGGYADYKNGASYFFHDPVWTKEYVQGLYSLTDSPNLLDSANSVLIQRVENDESISDVQIQKSVYATVEYYSIIEQIKSGELSRPSLTEDNRTYEVPDENIGVAQIEYTYKQNNQTYRITETVYMIQASDGKWQEWIR